MDTLLLAITVVSLIVALITSVTAWRLMRDEKQRSAARIAALSAAAADETPLPDIPSAAPAPPHPAVQRARTPWKQAPFDSTASGAKTDDLSLRTAASDEVAPTVDDLGLSSSMATPVSGFLGSTQIERNSGNRQRGLAIATVVFFIAITGGFLSSMSGSRSSGASAAAASGAPLELVSLSHARQSTKLSVSGLVRNPAAGQPVEKLSAVVFLFDRAGAFVTSARAHVDFLKLGAGDESPFVVSLDAPESVARYRVSFRTDDGVVPHIDRRGESPAAAEGDRPVNVTIK